MRLASTLASASTPRECVWTVQTKPAEQAFLDLIGRPAGAGGDADVAAAVKVLRFLVKASLMGSQADLDVLRGMAEQIDGKEAQRARVLRCVARASEPFAEQPEPTERAVKEGFERFPPGRFGDEGHEAIWDLWDWIHKGEELAREDPRIDDALRAMRRIVAVYELREDLSRIDPRFGQLDTVEAYRLLDRAVKGKGGKGNVGIHGLAARLSVSVGAFEDTEPTTAGQAFRDAQRRRGGRRC
jgi:hypothetical protein